MPISDKTQKLIQRRWRAFCEAVKQGQEEHGQRVECYFGESQVVCDYARLDAHHGLGDGSGRGSALAQASGLTSSGGTDWERGGSILVDLPYVEGFCQDGGGW